MTTTRLIALDWGTSSLRAYRLGDGGAILDIRPLPWGIMNLPPLPAAAAAAGDNNAGFAEALKQACGDWHEAQPDAPVIACGMIGSKQGWREAPYLNTPLTVDQIGTALTGFDTGCGFRLHVVPGLLQQSALPNVMRGEETQIAGVVAQRLAAGKSTQGLLIGLPGTHSKWARVEHDRIIHFDTFMTGEVYAALSNHTILGRTMQRGGGDDDAFRRGLAVAGSPQGAMGVLSTIFSCRTLGLTGALEATAQPDYLSGLLIGHEVAALRQSMQERPPGDIVLIGEAALCMRYQKALESYGMTPVSLALHATPYGLWKLAHDAGLLNQQEKTC
jgi:2-dehydro-3-deoxygalactonokinase